MKLNLEFPHQKQIEYLKIVCRHWSHPSVTPLLSLKEYLIIVILLNTPGFELLPLRVELGPGEGEDQDGGEDESELQHGLPASEVPLRPGEGR